MEKGKNGRKDAFNQCNFLTVCLENENTTALRDLPFLCFCVCLEFGPGSLLLKVNDSFITWMLTLKFQPSVLLAESTPDLAQDALMII